MEKEFKSAISLAFKRENKVLVLKRSESKKSFPGAWSIPSTYVQEDESVSDTANRLVRRKLGLEEVSVEEVPLGVSPIVNRGDYDFKMTDFVVSSYTGNINFNTTEYTEMRWVTPQELLELINIHNGGEMGECTRTFLSAEGLL